MRKYFWISLILAAISLGLSACATSGTNDTATSGAKTAMTDSDLENNIKARLDSDMSLKAANLKVSASADRNEATLSGTVDSEALRSKALELAKTARAGLAITDKIDVEPREMTRTEYTEKRAREERDKAKGYGEKIGDTLDDAWIHSKIVAKLIGNSTTQERKINVDVVDNAVTLRGTVETTQQKVEAERIAKETEGVYRVVNQLKVGGKS